MASKKISQPLIGSVETRETLIAYLTDKLKELYLDMMFLEEEIEDDEDNEENYIELTQHEGAVEQIEIIWHDLFGTKPPRPDELFDDKTIN